MKMPKMFKDFLSYCSKKLGWGAASEQNQGAQDPVSIINKSAQRINQRTEVLGVLKEHKQTLDKFEETKKDFVNNNIVIKFDQHMNKLERAYFQKNKKRMTPEVREKAEGIVLKKLPEAKAKVVNKALAQRKAEKMQGSLTEHKGSHSAALPNANGQIVQR